jgi:hypothetical protein
LGARRFAGLTKIQILFLQQLMVSMESNKKLKVQRTIKVAEESAALKDN